MATAAMATAAATSWAAAELGEVERVVGQAVEWGSPDPRGVHSEVWEPQRPVHPRA